MRYFLIFIVTFFIFIVAQLPASFVLSKIQLPKNIVIEGVTGSIWDAQIKRVVTDKIIISDVHAQLNMTSLITFSPSVDVQFGNDMNVGPFGYMTISQTENSFLIENSQFNLAVSEIVEQLNLPFPIAASGDIRLSVAAYQYQTPLCQQLDATVTWPKAKVTSGQQAIMLGDLSGQLSCPKGEIRFEMAPKNNLGLTLTAYVHQLGRYSGEGFVKPDANFPENLKPLLGFLGKPDSQGRYRLRF